LPKHLLPLIPAGLLVQQILPTPDCLTIVAVSHQRSASCPACATPSCRVHSRYERSFGDLPSQGRPVVLRVQVQRFHCRNPSCPRQTFAEPLSGIALRFARRTERLHAVHHKLGVALGGEAGARLAGHLAMPVSPDTLLRLVVRGAAGRAAPPTPRVLAVDDWAWRRGHRYGSVLVDLERNRMVDLLPDRQAETFAAWLRAHPGVEVIARDRAGAYADGARQGAPEAIQVADRWHVLRNLGTAVQVLADRHGPAVRRAARTVVDEIGAASPKPVSAEPSRAPPPGPTAVERRRQAAHAARQARYEEVAQLHAAGVSLSSIAAQFGHDRRTVRNWLRLGHAPHWNRPLRGSVLDAHRALLEQRWAEGCRNAAKLWRELVATGFTGRPSLVRVWAGQRRRVDRDEGTGQATSRTRWQPPRGARLRWLLMADRNALPETERAFVVHLFAEAEDLARAVAVAKRLDQRLRRESKEPLEAILDDAADTSLATFAASLRRDLDAVQASLDTPWTTSPAEGQINLIKTVKRSMYGRAGFLLLRARVLDAA
jgi:transposase